jgi:hypothetical protein
MRLLLIHPSPLMYSEIFLRLEPQGLERVAGVARAAAHEVRIVDLQVLSQKVPRGGPGRLDRQPPAARPDRMKTRRSYGVADVRVVGDYRRPVPSDVRGSHQGRREADFLGGVNVDEQQGRCLRPCVPQAVPVVLGLRVEQGQ